MYGIDLILQNFMHKHTKDLEKVQKELEKIKRRI
jgi:hypothetical protein